MLKIQDGFPPRPATEQEKYAEYDLVEGLKTGYVARWYGNYTTLVMNNEDMDKLLNDHVASFYRNLSRLYTRANGYPADFDRLPEPVQLALFDLIFNLGPSRLALRFPKLDRCIKSGDWHGAARESHRPQISVARNQYVRGLFLSAVDMKNKEAA